MFVIWLPLIQTTKNNSEWIEINKKKTGKQTSLNFFENSG